MTHSFPTRPSSDLTGKARACSRRVGRSQQRQEYVRLGREIVEKAFRQEGYELAEKALRGVLKMFKAETTDDLLLAVGDGQVTGREVLVAVYPGVKDEARQAKVVPPARAVGRASGRERGWQYVEISVGGGAVKK